MDNAGPITRFPKGMVVVPPSKSAAHRALFCAALAEGESTLHGLLPSQDLEATCRILKGLSARLEQAGDALRIQGGIRAATAPLHCGESGTTLRFAMAIAALLPGETTFTGEGRLLKRPHAPFLSALAAQGVAHRLGSESLTLRGPLAPGIFSLPGDVSSQYLSGLLLALPCLSGDSEIRLLGPLASAPYVGLTLQMLHRFGVQATAMGDGFRVPGNQRYRAASIAIEGDYSQAAPFLVAGALGCDVTCMGLSPDSLQGDRAILSILERSGATIQRMPGGGISPRPGMLRPQAVDMKDIPDLAPPVAVLLAACPGESRMTGVSRLRHKESDRLSAILENLERLGGDIRLSGDDLIIRGGQTLHGGLVETRGDHRIAMMGALLALLAKGPVYLDDRHCVAKSYPDFFRDFEKEEYHGA